MPPSRRNTPPPQADGAAGDDNDNGEDGTRALASVKIRVPLEIKHVLQTIFQHSDSRETDVLDMLDLSELTTGKAMRAW